jgi:hypothetical protein
MRQGLRIVQVICRLFAVLLVARGRVGASAEYKPIVVVSVASYEKLIADVRQFVDARVVTVAMELIGRAGNLAFDPRTLAPVSVDPRRPWGLVVESDGQAVSMYGFAPVTDMGLLLAGLVAAQRIQPPVEGVYQLSLGGRKWYARQRGAWAILSDSRDGLDDIPDEPAKILEEVKHSSDLAVSVLFRSLLPEHRELARRWITEGSYLVFPREAGEDEIQHALRQASANQLLLRAAALVEEGDALSAGISVDLKNRRLVADVDLTYLAATEMADGLAAPGTTKTDFGGFMLPNAALTGIWTGEIARMPLHQVLTLCDAVLKQLTPDARDRPELTLWRTIRDALLEESVDGAVAVFLQPRGSFLAIGGYVSDGAKVEKNLLAAAEPFGKVSGAGKSPTWTRDAGRYQDVRFHTLSIPLDANTDRGAQLSRMFGDSMELVLGVDDHHLYVAVGKQPMSFLKQSVRQARSRGSGRQPPVRFSLSLARCVRFLAETSPEADRGDLVQLADVLERSGGKDRVNLHAVPVERGVHIRLEAEEAAMRSLTLLGRPKQALPKAPAVGR